MIANVRLSFFTTFIFAALLSACSRGGPGGASHGGQDGGGGETYHSTSREVVLAIGHALTLASELNFDEPFGPRDLDDEIKEILEKVGDPLGPESRIDDPNQAYGPSLYLRKSRIVINDSHSGDYILPQSFVKGRPGPCPSNHGDVDASVSKNAVGADICFSVDKLRVYSPQTIDKEVFCLLIHEMAHLAGFGEVEANKLQKLFEQNYESVVMTDRAEFRLILVRQLAHTAERFGAANLFLKANSKTRFNLALGAIYGHLNMLQVELDPKLDFSWGFEHPELKWNVLTSVEKLVDILDEAERKMQREDVKGQDVLPVLEQAYVKFQEVCRTARTLAGGTTRERIEKNPTCPFDRILKLDEEADWKGKSLAE